MHDTSRGGKGGGGGGNSEERREKRVRWTDTREERVSAGGGGGGGGTGGAEPVQQVSSSSEERKHTRVGEPARRVRLHHTRVRGGRRDLFLRLRRRGRADGKAKASSSSSSSSSRSARSSLSTSFPDSGYGKAGGRFDGGAASCCLRQTLLARRQPTTRSPALESCSFSRFLFFRFPCGRKKQSLASRFRFFASPPQAARWVPCPGRTTS